ncbi:hypothetical protein VTN02DRAFT_6769 [Thermoascus thermophilus]
MEESVESVGQNPGKAASPYGRYAYRPRGALGQSGRAMAAAAAYRTGQDGTAVAPKQRAVSGAAGSGSRFSLASWDPSQDPSTADAHGAHEQPSPRDPSSDALPTEFSCQSTLRTVSPMTLPSSTDDHFHPDDWTPFHGPDPPLAVGVGMPLDAPLFYPAAKDTAMIVDDLADLQSDQAASLRASFPYANGAYSPAAQMPPDGGAVPHDFPGCGWFEGLDLLIPANLLSSFPGMSPDLQPPASQSLTGSASPSVAGDLSGVFDQSFSSSSTTTPGDVPAFVEPPLREDNPSYMEWHHASPEDMSQMLPKTAAVAVPPSDAPLSSRSRGVVLRHSPIPLQPVAAARKRRQRTASVSVSIEQQPQPKPLQIVQEDGQGGSISSEDFVSPPRGARRKGPLSVVGRANAGLRRKNKDTCVQCRMNKRKCDGNSPCEACRPTLHEQPCARACFASIVEYGTCNYISQRAINHPTLNGSGRVRMEIPSAFDLNDLLAFLSERRGKFNIRARQAWGSLYVLDLGETYKFLRSLSEYNGNSQSTFLEFIDRRIIESKDRSKNWLSCVKDCDPMSNIFALLSQWNNMPSRAAYSFVGPDGQERPMDVNNPEDRKEILLAAQLSRIFCRMLEVEGFRKLERDFYNIKWKRISHEAHLRFLNELGHILLSLRWRVSWWKRLGDGGAEPDPSKQHYVDRVELLCRILYVYYTSVLAKLRSWSSSDVPKGVWSTYADAEKPIWDDFPADPTDDGFRQWMERGKDLIEQAGVPSRVAKF